MAPHMMKQHQALEIYKTQKQKIKDNEQLTVEDIAGAAVDDPEDNSGKSEIFLDVVKIIEGKTIGTAKGEGQDPREEEALDEKKTEIVVEDVSGMRNALDRPVPVSIVGMAIKIDVGETTDRESWSCTESTMEEFWCFVVIDEVEGEKREGLVHLSNLSENRVSNAKEFAKRGVRVKVKLISISGTKFFMSMRDVDQKTGQDMMPQRSSSGVEKALLENTSSDSRSWINPYAPGMQSSHQLDDDDNKPQRAAKRMSAPERWEVLQLINSGVLSVEDYPTFEEEHGIMNTETTEEDFEVERIEEEPISREMPPVKIVKNPDASMQRAAMTQSHLAKERRELRRTQANQLIDSIPKDLNRPWENPMPEAGERHFAQELRGINMSSTFELPEWKQKSVGKNLSYGIVSNNSILEQRESLPVF
ncbi:hypothetical protein PsorP6_009007 [Peronosclerospora sorghi]|uniref:Uncharacterized protein n=1 Tax=Peronosclerospora sorghi TaxID=230839 RepID=A0ACC0VZX5_9STRA|nr:hypothetical protein PsorP6_009007 [Peronosclerospora sorghi]